MKRQQMLLLIFLCMILAAPAGSCSKKNMAEPPAISGAIAQLYLTDGPWVYFGSNVPGYPSNLYDSLFFTKRETFNDQQFEDSIDGWYSGSRIIISSFGKFTTSQSSAAPDTFETIFNPYTAGPTNLDTFLIKYLTDSLMVWGWYMTNNPLGYVKYDSLKKERKY